MKFNVIVLLFSGFILFVFNTCDDDNLKNDEFIVNFVTDTIPIFNYFDEKEFPNDTMLLLLKELNICILPEFYDDTTKALCSPRNYKFFKYNESLPLYDAFGLEIRATVDNFKLRRFLLFQRIDGELVKMRGFVAQLAEMHTTPNGYKDLMLLFPDREAGSFVVKFIWNNEDRMYHYETLEAIDGYLVKQAKQDSLSNVVLQRLTENNMFF